MGANETKVQSTSVEISSARPSIEPLCRVQVTGHMCKIQVGLDDNFTVSFERDFMIHEADIETAKRVLSELESGQPPTHNVIGIFGQFNGLGIWTRLKDSSHVFNPVSNPPRVICLRHHPDSHGFEMVMDYNDKSLAIVKQIVRAIANHTIY